MYLIKFSIFWIFEFGQKILFLDFGYEYEYKFKKIIQLNFFLIYTLICLLPKQVKSSSQPW